MLKDNMNVSAVANSTNGQYKLKNGKIKHLSCIMSPDIVKSVPANHLSGKYS